MSAPVYKERRAPLPHYHRAPSASSLLLADSAVPRAASAVAHELSRVLDTHRADVAAVTACAAQDPSVGAPAADAVLSDVLQRTGSLLARTAPGVRLAERNPSRAPTASCIASQVLTCVDRQLDVLEERLEVLYGLPRVSVEVPSTADVKSTSVDNGDGADFGAVDALDVNATPVAVPRDLSKSSMPSHSNHPFQDRIAQANVPDQSAVTPMRSQPASVSPPAPSTPQLEDFGIDDTALQGLTQPLMYHLGSEKKPRLPADAPYEDVVLRSVEALGIQTPVQVAAKFGSGLRGVPKASLPRAVDSPPTPEEVLDLPEMLFRPFARKHNGASSVDAPVKDQSPALPTHIPTAQRPALAPPQALFPDKRALSFDEADEEVPRESKPQTASALRLTRSRAKRAATEESVDARYSTMANYLQSKFPKAVILSACDILHTLHERKGVRSSLFIPKDELPGTFTSITADSEEQNMLIYALSKLDIIVLRKERKTNAVCYEFGA